MSTRLRGVPLALVAAVGYTAGMAGVWTFAEHGYDETALLMRDVIFALGLLVLATLVLARWSRVPVHRSGTIGVFGWLALVPIALMLVTLGASVMTGVRDWSLMFIVLVGTMLVGIGEETAFRGLALNGLAERFSLPWAVVLSSILFGLLHSVNVMLQPTGDTVGQVIQTAVVGLFFGWTYVLTGGNLVLVVVMHWLWDFALLGSQVTENAVVVFGGLGAVIQVGLSVGLTIYGFKKLKGMSWAQWDAARLETAKVSATDAG